MIQLIKEDSIMRRLIFLLVLLINASLLSMAQNELSINKLFHGAYSSDPQVTETYMTGTTKYLKNNKLNVIASFKAPASAYAKEVENLVRKDGAKAIGKNVRYKAGKLNFAFYMLPPLQNGTKLINRYIYFVNTAVSKGSDVMVVYIEGNVKEDEVVNLIRNIGKKSK